MRTLHFDVNRINCSYFSKGAQLNFYKEKYMELLPPEKTLFPKYINSGQIVLDLGCGAGRTTVHVHALTEKVIGTDLSEVLIAVAKEKYKDINFKVMDASCIEFPENFFDCVVFSYNGLCYLYPEEKRNAAVREVHRVLKKNGYFIFSSFNRFFPWTLYSMINIIITRIILGFFTKYKIHLTRYGVTINYETSPEEEIQLFKTMSFKLIEKVPMAEKIGYFGYKPDISTYYVFQKES